jgi:hypothetical protein
MKLGMVQMFRTYTVQHVLNLYTDKNVRTR